MKSVASVWLPIGLILALALLTFWLTQAVDVKQPEADKTRHDPDMIVENFTARQLGLDGAERYTLMAQKMLHFPDNDSTDLEGVKFVATEKNGPPISVVAPTARLSGKADEIFFLDFVQIVREPSAGYQRLVGETTYFHVIPELGLGRTDKPVKLTEGGNIMTAEGMELNNKTRVATLTKVKAIYHDRKL